MEQKQKVKVVCPGCGTTLMVKNATGVAERTITCPKCQTPINVNFAVAKLSAPTPIPPVAPEQHKQKSGSGKAWLIGVLTGLVVVLAGVLVWFMLNKNSSNSTGQFTNVETDASISEAVYVNTSTELDLPDRPNPSRLVNDFSGVLGNTQSMEDTLEQFAKSTSSQIAVVTVNDLQGKEPLYYAMKLGNKWGVGDAKSNNGVIILIKPKKQKSAGKVAISVGTGLERTLTDELCSSIIQNELIPRFKENDYKEAVWNALHIIMSLIAKE